MTNTPSTPGTVPPVSVSPEPERPVTTPPDSAAPVTTPPVSVAPVSAPPASAPPVPAPAATPAAALPPMAPTPPAPPLTGTAGAGTSAPSTGRSTPVTTVTSGTLIMGTYEIETLINSGGMGEVYRGRNIHNGELVAIKIVLPSLAHDPKIVALFQKESTTLSRLSHEAIVRYHVFTNDPTIGRPCMVMEFVSGTALSDRIEQGPMPLEDVQVMLRRVASGLDKAHRAGVVHRDLSPDNVILEENSVEHAKLIDFGIAKSTNIGAGTLLQGQFAGKFNWVSPEQLGAHGGVVDGRSDIYSLALLVAAASKGQVLPMGSSIVDAVGKRSSVPDLSGVDPHLVPLLRWMLQPDPALRIESMAKVIAALDNPALIPADAPAGPAAVDPNRTVIGGVLPITGSGAATSAPPLPAGSLPPVSGAATPAPAGATVISSQPPGQQMRMGTQPDQEPEDFSPFGSVSTPSAPAVAVQPAPAASKGKGGLVAILVLLVLGGGAGAYFGGVFDPKPLVQIDPNATAEEVAAAEAAAEAAATAAAEKAAQLEEDAKLVEIKAAEAAAAQAAAEEAAKLAEAEAKAAEAAAALKAAEEAAAKLTEAEAAEKAAQKAAEDAAAAQAAEDAAAQKAAEVEAAKLAAEAAEAQKAAEAEAARQAAQQAADEEAARLAADPVARQQAFLAGYLPPACVHVQLTEALAEGFRLDAYAIETKPLEDMVAGFTTATEVAPDVALHLINDAQCPVLDFANRYLTKAKPVAIRFPDAGELIKSGGTVSGVVEGLEGRPFTLFLVSEAGGATNLKPWVALASDGTASFSFTVSLAAGAPPAPQLLLAIATDTALAELDAVPNGVTAKSLMPFVALKLSGAALNPGIGLSFFRLEN